MAKVTIRIRVNGSWHALAVEPWERLVDVIRDRLGLTGTKIGCGEGGCGACTVNLDGKAVLSCLVLAVQADNRAVETIEGLQRGSELHPLQTAFVSQSAIQCGYCTPGMIMAANALLRREPSPSQAMVRQALANNLCRCTGYDQPVGAVLKAAEILREKNHG